MNRTDVIDYIFRADSADIENITQAIQLRRSQLASRTKVTLQVGDTVKFTFDMPGNRELPTIVRELVVLPKRLVKPIRSTSKDLFAFVATAGLTGAHSQERR